MRILLAEDNALLREGITEGLRQHGFQVDSTPDGIIIELYSDQNGPVEPFLCSIGWSNIVQLTLNGLAECWGAEDPGAGG